MMIGLTRALGMTKLFVVKHKADIAFGVGMGLTAFGTYEVVKKSFEFKERLDEHKEQMEAIKEAEETFENEGKVEKDGVELVPADIKKEKHDICKETVKVAIKKYALPASLLVAGEGLKIYAHTSLKSDLGAVSIALNTAIAAYEGIKEKVISTDGIEKWNEYAYDDAFETVADVDQETGEVIGETKVQSGGFRDMYAEFFDEGNPNYQKFPGANKTFIMMVEQWASDQIERNGFLLYHDVLKELGFKDSTFLREETCKAGWIFDKNRAHQCDFGLHIMDPATVRFMDEDEQSVLLRFDCIPNVYCVQR